MLNKCRSIVSSQIDIRSCLSAWAKVVVIPVVILWTVPTLRDSKPTKKTINPIKHNQNSRPRKPSINCNNYDQMISTIDKMMRSIKSYNRANINDRRSNRINNHSIATITIEPLAKPPYAWVYFCSTFFPVDPFQSILIKLASMKIVL
jgi:hypothetical protein